ncbi:MAG: TatD family hydrolase [Clostridia bacterium]|nr:TatD family hydrolase [Clostridia bacterium]
MDFNFATAPQGSIFDTHAHYDDERFDSDRYELLASLKNSGVGGVINCAVDIESSKNVIKIAEDFDFCYSAVGYHPENLPDSKSLDFEKLCELIKHKSVVAIGEIGLDYYWHQDNKDYQKQSFLLQTEFAIKNNLPVIVHDREAHADTLSILQAKKPRGVLHCFSGSVEMAESILKLGMYIGVGGVVTFKNSKKLAEVVKSLPLNRILLETDAPYMAPEPFRGKTNNSAYILFVAKKIAEIKGVTETEVLEQTYLNAKNLFGV